VSGVGRTTDGERQDVADDHHDEYLLAVYEQAGHNARMYAASRFSNLTGFLTYISVLTAALTFLYGNADKHPSFGPVVGLVSLLGGVLSLLFLVMEMRHHHWWQHYEFGVVAPLEREMLRGGVGAGQYPADMGPDGSRAFVAAGGWQSRMRLSATKATYGIYLTTTAFFVAVGALALLR
jgi:hypothetical protein